MIKIIVAGSRDFDDFDTSDKILAEVVEKMKGKIQFVSGAAQGADQAPAHFMAKNRNPRVFLKYFPAEWKKYGKGAGFIRNGIMADYADALLAIWDGSSNGTLNMIEQMEKRDKSWALFGFDGVRIK